jgi:type IV pilus assembly protein PilA
LAAIAIPAYQDYTGRAQAAEAFTLLDGLKTAMVEQHSADSTLWTIPAGSVVSGNYVAGIVATLGPPNTLVATYVAAGANAKVIGKTVTFSFNPATGAWSCASTLAAEIKPKSCV